MAKKQKSTIDLYYADCLLSVILLVANILFFKSGFVDVIVIIILLLSLYRFRKNKRSLGQ